MQTGEGHYSGIHELQQLVLEKGHSVAPSSQHLRMFALDVLPHQHQYQMMKPRFNIHAQHLHPCIPFSLDHHFAQEHLQLSLGEDSSENQLPFSNRTSTREDEEITDVERVGDEESGQTWTSEETLALVRIRSETDLNSESMPWETISRRLLDLGYSKTPNACKEKCAELGLKPYQGKSCIQYSELEAVYGNSGNKSLNSVPEAIQPSKPSLPEDSIPNAEKQQNRLSQERLKRKKKRKAQQMTSIIAYLDRMVKQLMQNQEALHNRFLEILESRDKERLEREEVWRRQEMERLAREAELRAQERALASARETAIVNFLQKITGQTLILPEANTAQEQLYQNSGEKDLSDPNGKRWPKPEVQALIRLRSKLEPKFQESGPKGALWQEISEGMAALGFTNRSAKRCKEKWENINKYFRKTKDSLKKRPENAKTCPYFHQLDILYRKGILSSPNKSSKLEHSQEYCSSEHITSENNNNGNLYYITNSEAVDQVVKLKPENKEEIGSSNLTEMPEGLCDVSNLKASMLEAGQRQQNFLKDLPKKEEQEKGDAPATQSALMALVDKLTSEMTADYSVSATSNGFT